MLIINVMMSISEWLWGWPLLIISFGVAMFLSFRLKFFQFSMLRYIKRKHTNKKCAKSKLNGDISSFQACCTALASTLGVGNIAGVSIAIAIGGPGAVFWMWFVALIGFIVKFSEITLGLAYRKQDPETKIYQGGFYWYVKYGIGEKWKWLGIFWAILLGCAMVFAPAVQINSIVSAINNSFSINPYFIGMLSATIMFCVLSGGIKRISVFVEKVVPVMAFFYIVISLFVLIRFAPNIPNVIIIIFKYAFTPASASGGFVGSSVLMAIRWGLARGIYSNEAGTGMAPLAHSSAKVDHPVKQGMWGILEVFVDTIVICTMTALVVLCTGAWNTGATGAALTAQAFGVAFGNQLWGTIFISIIITFFGFTTALINVYYGEICISIIWGRRGGMIFFYRILGCVFAIIGAIGSLRIIWNLFDFFFGICALLNLFALMMLNKKINYLVNDYIYRFNSDNWAKSCEEVVAQIAELKNSCFNGN